MITWALITLPHALPGTDVVHPIKSWRAELNSGAGRRLASARASRRFVFALSPGFLLRL